VHVGAAGPQFLRAALDAQEEPSPSAARTQVHPWSAWKAGEGLANDERQAGPTDRQRPARTGQALPGPSLQSAILQGSSMKAAASVFKAYDIRGIVRQTIDETFAEHLGRAFGTEALKAGERTVAVGRDGRLSGPGLAMALSRGLASTGIDVLELGAVTTPMAYYAAATRDDLGCHSCIQVTGSHNPKDYNGFKMVLAGRAIYGDEIQGLRRRIEAEDYAHGDGRVLHADIEAEYAQRIVGDCKLARRMKIVVDSGNGIPGATAPQILRALGCDVTALYSEVDGDFPNHHPDPSKPENLADLIRTVKETDAELGLAFDGDGDRLGVVTKDGHIIYPDRQLMLFAQDILGRQPGATIIFDVKCSQRLAEVVREAGGVPLMWKTGHSLVKAKLKETGAPIAGEMSGHIFFKERWYGFDDAMYTAARLLEILSRSQDPSAVLNALPTSFSTPELNVACAEGEPAQVMERLRATAKFPGAEITTIDGVRADYPDGFGLCRASNTTPVLVLRFEGHTQEALHRIETDFMTALRAVKPDAQFAAAAH
jgi:phosphomannomutase